MPEDSFDLEVDSLSMNEPEPKDLRSYEFFTFWKKNGPACLITSNPFKNKVLFDFITSHGMEATPVGPMIFDRCYGKFVDIDWGMLVLCIDDFDGLGQIFNKLRYFRDKRPHVPVILTSFGFRSHDLTEERLAICDLSLKFPVDLAALDDVFEAMWHNNRAWVQRVAELQNTASADANWSRLKQGMAMAWWQGLSDEETTHWTARALEEMEPGDHLRDLDIRTIALAAHRVLLREGEKGGVVAWSSIAVR
jgi:hypothetical protein